MDATLLLLLLPQTTNQMDKNNNFRLKISMNNAFFLLEHFSSFHYGCHTAIKFSVMLYNVE